MAGALQFDLVSPERRLASLQVVEVQIPGADGDLTAMEGHAPVITTLRPGVLKVVSAEATRSFAVTGGFAEITASGVSVLAERAVPLEEATGALIDSYVAEAREQAALAAADDRDSMEKFIQDLINLRSVIAA
ncbi:F0F1 ATP synthase subunit epsilon [Szabonella alba]|uniref:ATP synthase epsilon chain n=1 Tax=Szabonella alba TaxID=2804194 RepID=A0A8K0Y235_9RHOB|nr:F0F1 ATP synthase subunit epsilon [Szabonella alba]MBL4918933.1 F0F1 ATP synthase subunit epsilon [Szabonella alba]